jgi:hypothetical protein
VPSDADYQGLLAFRDQLRRFLHWSEQQALAHGVTPAHYQLLLAIRGHPTARRRSATCPNICCCVTTAWWDSWTARSQADLVERCPDPRVSALFASG